MSAAIIGLVGVVIGSTLTWIKDLAAHLVKRRSNGRYAAVRIIAVLDEYAQKCVSVVGDDGTCEGRPAGRTEQGEEYYDPQVTSPEPPTFSDDVDWQSISFRLRSEEHTSELQSLMRISYAVFCLKKTKKKQT